MGTWYCVDEEKDEWLFEDDYIALKNKQIEKLQQELDKYKKENDELKEQLAKGFLE